MTDHATDVRIASLLPAFEKAASSRRKEWMRQVQDAKVPETRKRRIDKLVAQLSA